VPAKAQRYEVFKKDATSISDKIKTNYLHRNINARLKIYANCFLPYFLRYFESISSK